LRRSHIIILTIAADTDIWRKLPKGQDAWDRDRANTRGTIVSRHCTPASRRAIRQPPRSARENLAALAPRLPVSAVVSEVAIAVCFAAEEDCAAFIIRAINNAAREILVGAYGLTPGSGIVEALIRAKERGVDVQLIADKTTPCERASGIEPWPRQASRSG
jgi:phosphatidylserine/phosphatidylglycerophosphate/cardiolipin synthase-like enzyme